MESQLIITNSPSLNLKKDFFSYTFEKNTPVEVRHENGQYFTHKELVNLIIKKIPITQESKVLDPTCGAGAFLIEAIKKTDAENVYGVDIDGKALDLCKVNLNSQKKINTKNFVKANFIKDDIFRKNSFDVVIGNPPFQNLKADGSDYDSNYPIYKKVLSNIGNSATLVLARSYELLKDGGYMGFVLPKNFIRVDSFQNIRNFILENTKIISITDVDHHFKDVRCDQILLILQKNKLTSEDQKKNLVCITPYKRSISLKDQESYFVSQSEFFNYSFYPLFYNRSIKKVVDKLFKIKHILGDYCEIYRGLSIGSSHPSLSKQKNLKLTKCYRGDSIKRFGLKYYLYLDKSKLTSGEKDKLSKLLRDKIVTQNIFSKEGGVFLNFSKADEVSLDTVTNIIPNKNINPYLLMGLLGSRLANFFLINAVYLNSNFTMHTDKSYLGKIPLVIPNSKEANLIQTYARHLLKINDKYSKEFNDVYDKLNRIIFGLYNLNENEIRTIEEFLKSVMSKKHG